MFVAGETARVERSLARLALHLAGGEPALTGGIAVEYHLAKAGHPGNRQQIADLDLVTRQVHGLRPSVTHDFLVSHDHRPGPGVPKAILQLVDPVARLRIDIFPDSAGALAGATHATVGTVSVLMLGARSILAHKVQTLQKASRHDPVDPKHWHDARALAEICGCAPPPAPRYLAPQVFCTAVDADVSLGPEA